MLPCTFHSTLAHIIIFNCRLAAWYTIYDAFVKFIGLCFTSSIPNWNDLPNEFFFLSKSIYVILIAHACVRFCVHFFFSRQFIWCKHTCIINTFYSFRDTLNHTKDIVHEFVTISNKFSAEYKKCQSFIHKATPGIWKWNNLWYLRILHIY